MLDSEYNKKIGNKNNVVEFLKNTSAEDLNYYLSKNSMQMLQQKKIDEWLQRLHSCLSSILNIISQFQDDAKDIEMLKDFLSKKIEQHKEKIKELSGDLKCTENS